jgi:hypothetical protein
MTSQEQAEQELAQARQDLVEQTAVVRGLEERVRFLREHAAEPGPFSEFGRTDAILAVLRSAPESLTIPQVYEGLRRSRSLDRHPQARQRDPPLPLHARQGPTSQERPIHSLGLSPSTRSTGLETSIPLQGARASKLPLCRGTAGKPAHRVHRSGTVGGRPGYPRRTAPTDRYALLAKGCTACLGSRITCHRAGAADLWHPRADVAAARCSGTPVLYSRS